MCYLTSLPVASIVYDWWWINEWVEHCWIDDGKANILGENPDQVPLYPPQIPHGLAWSWTRAFVVRDQSKIAWAMVQVFPLHNSNAVYNCKSGVKAQVPSNCVPKWACCSNPWWQLGAEQWQNGNWQRSMAVLCSIPTFSTYGHPAIELRLRVENPATVTAA